MICITFVLQSQLEMHYLRHSLKASPMEVNLECRECEATFTSYAMFARHSKVHRKPDLKFNNSKVQYGGNICWSLQNIFTWLLW